MQGGTVGFAEWHRLFISIAANWWHVYGDNAVYLDEEFAEV